MAVPSVLTRLSAATTVAAAMGRASPEQPLQERREDAGRTEEPPAGGGGQVTEHDEAIEPDDRPAAPATVRYVPL
jgi:hypothetical protein